MHAAHVDTCVLLVCAILPHNIIFILTTTEADSLILHVFHTFSTLDYCACTFEPRYYWQPYVIGVDFELAINKMSVAWVDWGTFYLDQYFTNLWCRHTNGL